MTPPEIQEYEFGRMVVDGEEHRKDLIVLPNRVMPGWWRRRGHRLDVADLDEVLGSNLDVLVVGTGAHGKMEVPSTTRHAVAEAGVQLLVERTLEAVRRYNELRTQRHAAACVSPYLLAWPALVRATGCGACSGMGWPGSGVASSLPDDAGEHTPGEWALGFTMAGPLRLGGPPTFGEAWQGASRILWTFGRLLTPAGASYGRRRFRTTSRRPDGR